MIFDGEGRTFQQQNKKMEIYENLVDEKMTVSRKVTFDNEVLNLQKKTSLYFVTYQIFIMLQNFCQFHLSAFFTLKLLTINLKHRTSQHPVGELN